LVAGGGFLSARLIAGCRTLALTILTLGALLRTTTLRCRSATPASLSTALSTTAGKPALRCCSAAGKTLTTASVAAPVTRRAECLRHDQRAERNNQSTRR
jgi:hypothetical protein